MDKARRTVARSGQRSSHWQDYRRDLPYFDQCRRCAEQLALARNPRIARFQRTINTQRKMGREYSFERESGWSHWQWVRLDLVARSVFRDEAMLSQRPSSSGQQILEAIQPSVARLVSFIRQGTWIFGPFGPEPPRKYTQAEIEDYVRKPGLLLELRKQNERRFNSFFGICLSDSKAQADMRSHIASEMKKQLRNPHLENLIIPTTGVGCRRPTPGINYLKALTAENVEVVYGEIAKITPNGCVGADGIERPLDILVCATGFDTSYIPQFPLIGQHGKKLGDEWATRPKAYLAIAVADFPNYFVFYGPNNPFASGPFLATVECQADYMLKLIDRYQTENIRSFAPKAEAVADFTAHASKVLAKTVWAENCRSWYRHNKDEHGFGPQDPLAVAESLTIWPGSGVHYIEAMADVRADDWDIVYEGNRFAWLGNGFSQAEADGESDLAWYVREEDDGPYLSKAKWRMALIGKKSTTSTNGVESSFATEDDTAPRNERQDERV